MIRGENGKDLSFYVCTLSSLLLYYILGLFFPAHILRLLESLHDFSLGLLKSNKLK